MLCLAGLLVPTSALAADGDAPGSARIVNGNDVDDTAFASRWSSIVAVATTGHPAADVEGQYCAGTLIAPTLVVTAAHCVVDGETALTRTPASITVFAGAHDLRQLTQSMSVRAVMPHPAYRYSRLRHDVAILRLAQPAAAPASPIQLVQAAELDTWGAGSGIAGSAAAGPWVAGWGNTEYDQLQPANYPFNLKEVQVPIQSDVACGNERAGGSSEFQTRWMLCAGTTDSDGSKRTTNGKGTCPGDSGGPLIVSADGDGPPWRLAGVVSWGDSLECAGPLFGFFARIDTYRDWLQSIGPADGGPYGLQEPAAPVVTMRSHKRVGLAWAPPGSGPTPDAYEVYDYVTIDGRGLQIPLGTARSGERIRLDGLWPNTKYRLFIKSRFEGGESVGASVIARTLRDRRAPSRPGPPRVVRADESALTLRWRRSRDNHLVRRYAVFAKRGADRRWKRIGRTRGPRPTFTARNLRPGSYRFTVRAVDYSSNAGRRSRPLRVLL